MIRFDCPVCGHEVAQRLDPAGLPERPKCGECERRTAVAAADFRRNHPERGAADGKTTVDGNQARRAGGPGVR